MKLFENIHGRRYSQFSGESRHYFGLTLFLPALLSFLCCVAQPGPGQPSTRAADSAMADHYYDLSFRFWQTNADSILKYAEMSLGAARRAGYLLGEANALLSEGVAYGLHEENLRALDCYLQALKISIQINISGLTCNLYNNIGNVYSQMQEYSKSNQYYVLALQMNLAIRDRRTKAILLTNMADNYRRLNKYDSALDYNFQAFPTAAAIKDSVLMAAILLNTGEAYCARGSLSQAMGYFQQCGNVAIRIQDDEDMTWAYVSMADVLFRQESYRQSIRLAEKALRNARRLSFSEIVIKSYSVLYSDYKGLKKYDSALGYRNLEVFWKDSLFGIERSKQMAGLQSRYELEKKEIQLDLLNQKNLLAEKEVQTERERHFMFAGAALFFSLWAIFLYKGNREVDRLNRELRLRKGAESIFD